eukprot:CAMPEP_0174304818 /NCGR_PEP_ID=MMETSP0809-20121228/61019_1 /TAXON_ID=73025 ORGANISM="Eutreptiella gymnastica-like, Strain CCMP1594" /NCGR_SAMPLE_ID=MMETSP0809 /ASSEMBLY_ACC=CAM_ASM_000658 /LENGTH=62 /DNA_ID=CAMNT_0015411131 /DNA_START=1204 /DNA_END=1392 /DNA_ORIENTATION=-
MTDRSTNNNQVPPSLNSISLAAATTHLCRYKGQQAVARSGSAKQQGVQIGTRTSAVDQDLWR